ncbi:MAG TPA: leucyl aminopeptidase [Bacteroidales bacterium]|nr:leucyl aminopeptidase [Bacteroidales bacterium]HQI70868.1 leucyl aminopeptidase [Bacteroidales bacterium]
MKLRIQLVKEISDNDHLIIISPTEAQLLKAATARLNKAELAYLKSRIEKDKKGIIAIDRLGQYLFFYILSPRKKAPHLVSEEMRKAGHGTFALAEEHHLETLTLYPQGLQEAHIEAFAEGMALSAYQFIKYRSKAKEEELELKTLKIFSKLFGEKHLQRLNVLTEAVHNCRDMVNEPVCHMNSQVFASQTMDLLKNSGARVEVLNKAKITAYRMNGLLAVNRGSADPPAFLIMEWNPPHPVNHKPLVLVGKGLLYDTGGINIKTSAHMENMKNDMAGGAAVVSALYAVAKTKLPVHVVGLVPLTDNRPAGNALVPGDIIEYSDGTTVEVLNSDAEGRLILADGMIFAKKFHPSLVITIATLTGSAQSAIGKYGIVSMHQQAQKYFKNIQSAGDSVFERVVEFPFWDDYDELIKSNIADIKNTGGPYGGAITAGKFLAHFANYPFIHLDIAGPAFNDKKDSYRGTGGSGVGVRLFYEFIKRLASQ